MPFKILYVEDNHDNLLIVKRALEARGYQLIWAQNGKFALTTARKEYPDLILLDINLPDIDGYEVARRIRRSRRRKLRYVPIIALTANALRGDAEKALAAGCDMYMAKPINIRELWSRVASFLSNPS